MKLKNKKKEVEVRESDRVYLLTNQTKVRCIMWDKYREHMYAEVLNLFPKISVYVPANYIVKEITPDETTGTQYLPYTYQLHQQ